MTLRVQPASVVLVLCGLVAPWSAWEAGSQLFAEFGNAVDVDAASLLVGAHRAYPDAEEPTYTADAGAAFILSNQDSMFGDGFE